MGPVRITINAPRRLRRREGWLGAAIFLAAPASDFVTGQTLVVDGGYTLY